MAEARKDGILKAALLLDSLAPEVVDGIRLILAVRDKEGASYAPVPELLRGMTGEKAAEVLAGAADDEVASALLAMPAPQGADFLDALPAERRPAVAARALAIDPVLAARTLRGIEKKLVGTRVREELRRADRHIALVLGDCAPATARAVLAALPAGPEADSVRARAVTIESFASLTDGELPPLLAEFQATEIARALCDAPQDLRARVLARVPPRVREVVAEELRYLKPSPESVAARRRLAARVAAVIAARGAP